MKKVIAFCFGAVALNLLGAWCTRKFGLPLYLDSISTLATAFLFGLVPSLFVAVLTNGVMYFIFSAPLIFTTCHIMTAVGAWAVFRFGKKNQTLNEDDLKNPVIDLFLFAGLLSALSNGIFGSVYSVMLSQTHKETLVEGLSGFLILITNNLPLSHFWSGIVTNLADKTLGALISFMIVIAVKKVQNDSKKDEKQVQGGRAKVFKKSSSYLTTTILIILSAVNIISCFVFQSRYRKISGTEQNLESSLYIMILASIILIASCFFILYAKMIQVRKEKELEDKQREWHKKISFDLHDGVLQNLVALKSRMETELKEHDPTPEIQLIQSTVSELRLLCGILRLDDKTPFEESLHHTLDVYERTYGFATELIIATDLSFLATNQKEEILRILYECLSNTARHSDAKNVSVSFADDGNGKLYFTVRDDGKSTETKETEAFHGLGLESIKNRAQSLGGKVEFLQTEDGWTTRIVISI